MVELGFIGGYGRSGTTLLERIVDQLPGVCALGEVMFVWQRGIVNNELCACGQPFHDCPFWQEVGLRAFGGWDKPDVAAVQALSERANRTRYIPADIVSGKLSTRHAVLRAYADFFVPIYRAAAEVSGSKIVVDSSKNASMAFALRAHEEIAMRVIHVVRDSRGVAYSWTKEVVRPEAGQDSDQPLMDQYSPAVSAFLWNAHNGAFGALRTLGTPVHKVFYERFLEAPVAQTQQIADFLGVESATVTEFLSQDIVTLGPSHQVAGNPMRFRTGELRLRSDEAWRAELPPSARRVVTALTLPMMARYRYVGPGRWKQ